MDENIGRNFSPLNVYDCYSTTKAAIHKWVVQTDSAHQRDALSSSRITVTILTIRQLPLDIMQSTDRHSQRQPETMPDIISTVLSGSE
jgi:hypothetical protein